MIDTFRQALGIAKAIRRDVDLILAPPARLFTFGYAGSDPATLRAHAERLDATVLDIRYTPMSRLPAWRPGALRTMLGEHRYRQCRALGNANHAAGGPIRLADPEAGLAELTRLLEAGPVILLCVCRDWSTCHRRVVAEMASDRLGVRVEHL